MTFKLNLVDKTKYKSMSTQKKKGMSIFVPNYMMCPEGTSGHYEHIKNFRKEKIIRLFQIKNPSK